MARVEWVTGRARDRSADRIAAAHKRVAGRHHPARRVGVPRQTRESADHPPAVVGVRLGRFRRHFIPPAAALAAEGPDVRLEGAHPVGDDVGVPLGGSEQRSAVEALFAAAESRPVDDGRRRAIRPLIRVQPSKLCVDRIPARSPVEFPGTAVQKLPASHPRPLGEGESARIDSSYGRTCRGLACRLSGLRGGAKQFRPSIQSPRAVGSDVASLQDNSALTSQAYKTTQTARIACLQTAGRPIPPSKRLRLASEKTSARPPVSKPCLSLWTRWRSGLRPRDSPVYDTEGQK